MCTLAWVSAPLGIGYWIAVRIASFVERFAEEGTSYESCRITPGLNRVSGDGERYRSTRDRCRFSSQRTSSAFGQSADANESPEEVVPVFKITERGI